MLRRNADRVLASGAILVCAWILSYVLNGFSSNATAALWDGGIDGVIDGSVDGVIDGGIDHPLPPAAITR